ncbi:MAG: RidA family protein [Pseudomonadales bacterium]|jgi:enamine deaminase RidA (YjgF/YER057c/UK114 family)|nr:RidA family protein [Pseudomonadales bacterium]MDP6470164.1 RidA family protein [Pseudomonadales bacterium]MDP6827070.1 RidA family protein [Pseudomonadales bacterium]|tara:strand:+ start:156 stop:542 length:387 start_codon:yes stop_codon:yes gene_type:complete
MTREVVVPESQQGAYNNFHFAPAVKAGDLLLCSGQIGTGTDGKVPPTAEEEFRNAWTAIGTVLQEAGLGYENIVEYTTYHVDMHDHLGDFMKVRDEFIEEPWPAWTAIGTTGLAVPGARVEIRVVATS